MSNRAVAWVVASAVVVGLLAVLLVLYAAIDTDINALKGASAECARTDQCEQVQESKIFAEPQNTLSNLAYLFAGLCILVRAMRPGFDRQRVPALVVGASFALLAVLSGYYHATLNNLSAVGKWPGQCVPGLPIRPQELDVVGVYLSLLSIICFGLDRLLRRGIQLTISNVERMGWSALGALICWLLPWLVADYKESFFTGLAIWIVCGVWLTAIWLMARLKPSPWLIGLVWVAITLCNVFFGAWMRMGFGPGFDSDMVFAVLIGLLAGVTAMNLLVADGRSTPRRSWGEVLVTLSAFAVGMAARISDGAKRDDKDLTLVIGSLCSPHALLQAHAAWHLISALALLLTYDLIEKSAARQGESSASDDAGPGTALLPIQMSLVDWLAAGGACLGRRWRTLFFNGLFTVAAMLFYVVIIRNPGTGTLLVVVPVATSVYLWMVSYLEIKSLDEL